MPFLLLQALARWLHFAGYALAFGPIAFRALVLGAPDRSAAHERLQRLSHAGIVLLLAAEPITLMTSGLGPTTALRLGAPLLLWSFAGALARAGGGQDWPLLLLGLGLAAVDGGGSLLALHLAAMGLWGGGLASLLAVWPMVPQGTDRALVAARFGRLAALAVLLLAASGTFLAATHVSSPGELITTLWGRVLIAKLAGVTVALLLAWRRLWHYELWLQTLVLALAALLATIPPPH
ncbi:MAG: hypothetical protein JWN15_2528 [Firmicutes bacterium]|nr:hypothetical protein [Bacillota bacterium]